MPISLRPSFTAVLPRAVLAAVSIAACASLLAACQPTPRGGGPGLVPNIDLGGGYVYENRAPATDIPQEHAPAVEAGVTEAVERGPTPGRTGAPSSSPATRRASAPATHSFETRSTENARPRPLSRGPASPDGSAP